MKTSQPNVAIVGAGILGRLLTYQLYQQGWRVSLFDQGDLSGQGSCSYAAGGMLSPFCELESAEPIIAKLGMDSLELWQKFLQKLDHPVFFQKKGSLVVSHLQDQNELLRLRSQVLLQSKNLPHHLPFLEVEGHQIQDLEPDLDRRFHKGLFFPHEGQISAREVLAGLGQCFQEWSERSEQNKEEKRIQLHFQEKIFTVSPHKISTAKGESSFDVVIDCRGRGAGQDLPTLRGIKGEIILVRAREVHFNRPIRLMHPRYPLYIIPRPQSLFLIGATSLETEHIQPISVRSLLELLTAAYSVHSGFAEGFIEETVVQWRPAFPNHLPRIECQTGLIRANGLYRHGFLISPQLVQLIEEYLIKGAPLSTTSPYYSLFEFK